MATTTEFSNQHMGNVNIDTDSLIMAIFKETGRPVFDDSFGGGVAFANNKSHKTYHELAAAFDIDINDHLEA